jgi:hypothetical protein
MIDWSGMKRDDCYWQMAVGVIVPDVKLSWLLGRFEWFW